jgi:hypothetical protein
VNRIAAVRVVRRRGGVEVAGVIQQGVNEELVAVFADLDGADVGRSGGGGVLLLAGGGLLTAGLFAPFVVHLAHDPFILNIKQKDKKKRHDFSARPRRMN